ncbi:MAG: hypothetical protein IJB41_01555 [Clostridia bacterium]|nr:hypothetical protein [Clostridia bacterium]
MIALPFPAEAQSETERLIDAINLSALQELAGDLSIKETAIGLLRGETDLVDTLIGSFDFKTVISNAGMRAGQILIPIGLWGLCPALLGERGAHAAGKFCACTLAASLAQILFAQYRSAMSAAERIALLCEGAAPVLTTLLSASGAVTSSALLTPAAGIAAQICTELIGRYMIPILGCCGVLAVCPAFSERFSFSGLRKLMTGACTWLQAGVLGLFMSVLHMRGMLKTGMDGLSMQTAKYTIDSLLPVVGGDVADSLGLLVASAKAVHAGVGAVCCALLLSFCIEPVCAAAAAFLLVRVCRAIVQPIGAGGAIALLDGFSEVLQAMLVSIVCAAVLFVMLLGASFRMAAALG